MKTNGTNCILHTLFFNSHYSVSMKGTTANASDISRCPHVSLNVVSVQTRPTNVYDTPYSTARVLHIQFTERKNNVRINNVIKIQKLGQSMSWALHCQNL